MFRNLFSTQGRVIGLDMLRATAILLVLISHSRVLLSPLKFNLAFLSVGGFLGVELFFVLSGFLIGTILIKVQDKNNRIGGRELKDFWVRRWFRTVPNYYLALLINALVYFYLTGQNGLTIKHFIFIQSFFRNETSFYGESWSLAVEEWFYLLLPLSLCLIQYFHGTKRNSLILTLSLFLLTIVISRVVYVFKFDPTWDQQVRKITFFRLDAIFWGVLFAFINYYYKLYWDRFKVSLLVTGFFLIIFSVYYYEVELLSLIGSKKESFFSRTFYFDVVSIGFALTIPFFNSIKSIKSISLSKLVVYISVISYSLYLYHYGFFIKLITHYFPNPSVPLSFVLYFSFWVATMIFCTLIYSLYEKPMTLIRERFSMQKHSFNKV